MKIEKVLYSTLQTYFDEIESWNNISPSVKGSYEISQFEKNKGSRGFEWWIALDNDNFVGAVAVMVGPDSVYLNEIMAKPGGGYGIKMMKEIFDYYTKAKGNQLRTISFDSWSEKDQANGTNNLASHYAKYFPDFEQEKNSWGGTKFTKHFKTINGESKMKNTDKVTLTVGQLKKLVREAQEAKFSEVEQIVKGLGSALEKANSTLTKLEKKDAPKGLVNDIDRVLTALSNGLDRIESKYL